MNKIITTNIKGKEIEIELEPGYGYNILSDEEMAEQFNLSEYQVKKYNKSLIEKGLVDIIEVDGIKIKRIHLKELDLR